MAPSEAAIFIAPCAANRLASAAGPRSFTALLLTRTPPTRQYLARDAVCERHGGEPKADQDLGGNQTVDVLRAGRDGRSDE